MKNNRIQFWRVVFTYLIALYHLNKEFNITTSWYIGVEFFFILSGYLLMKKAEKSNESAAKYTLDKVQRFFPHCLFAFFIAFGGYGFLHGYTLKEWGVNFLNSLTEIFLIHEIGLNYDPSSKMNSVTWYISVLLIVGYFMWYMVKNHKKVYVEVIAPFLVLFIYAYLYRTYGNLSKQGETIGFWLNSEMLRGIAAMNCGVIAFYAKALLDKFKMNNNAKKCMIIISDLCFALVILGGAFAHNGAYDYMYVVLYVIAIVFAFTDEKPRWYFNNKLVDFLGTISFSVYVNHNMFRYVFKRLLLENLSITSYIIYLVLITVYSICTYILVNKLVKVTGRCCKKIFGE